MTSPALNRRVPPPLAGKPSGPPSSKLRCPACLRHGRIPVAITGTVCVAKGSGGILFRVSSQRRGWHRGRCFTGRERRRGKYHMCGNDKANMRGRLIVTSSDHKRTNRGHIMQEQQLHTPNKKMAMPHLTIAKGSSVNRTAPTPREHGLERCKSNMSPLYKIVNSGRKLNRNNQTNEVMLSTLNGDE